MKFLSTFTVISVISLVLGAGRFKRLGGAYYAKEGSFPYQVGIMIYIKDAELPTWCGGSIINNEWILTAAHCTQNATSVEVFLGETKISSHKMKRKVEKNNIIVHPKWNPHNMANDISLIKITYTPFSSEIQPINLPFDKSYEGSTTIASGWGNINDGENVIVNELRWAEFNVIKMDDCVRAYPTTVISTNICVQSKSGSYLCGGDSGGPLVLKNSKIQVGVSSFVSGSGCSANYPSVFTRVSSYLDWIKFHTKY